MTDAVLGIDVSKNTFERSLVMVLDCLTPETIPELEVRTGVPLGYRLKADSTVAAKETLPMIYAQP